MEYVSGFESKSIVAVHELLATFVINPDPKNADAVEVKVELPELVN